MNPCYYFFVETLYRYFSRSDSAFLDGFDLIRRESMFIHRPEGIHTLRVGIIFLFFALECLSISWWSLDNNNYTYGAGSVPTNQGVC